MSSLPVYKAIVNFVKDLSETFGKKHKPLRLYYRIIEKTLITDEKTINKQVNIFRHFCIGNRKSIVEQNKNHLDVPLIAYSSAVYIDMRIIFKLADPQTTKIIWQHLLCLSVFLDGESNAREILTKMRDDPNETIADSINPNDVLQSTLANITSSINPNSSPMDIMSNLMSSGSFSQLSSAMSSPNGMSGIMGAVKGMLNNMKNDADPETQKVFGMIDNMTGMLDNIQKGTVNPTDLQGIIGNMSSMLSTLQTADLAKAPVQLPANNDSETKNKE